MKPAWDKLGAAFKGSKTVVIADVDCTSDKGKKVCEKVGVTGYPTIKYYNSTHQEGTKYEGGRDLKSLKKFVKKTLGGKERVCEPLSKTDCEPSEIEYLEQWDKKTAAEIDAEIQRLSKKLDEVLKSAVRQKLEFEKKLLGVLRKALGSGKSEL